MKDYRTLISLDEANKIVDFAINNEYTFDCFDGCLVDSYIIYNTESVRIGRMKSRKNIIIREIYMNEWSSGLELIMTDNEETVKNFIKNMEVIACWEKFYLQMECQTMQWLF